MFSKLKGPLLLLALASPLSPLRAATYYYDMSRPSESLWTGANAWSLTSYDDNPVYNQAWDNTASNNNVATFRPTTASYYVDLGGATINFGSGGINRIGSGGADLNFMNGTFNFNGGSIYTGINSGYSVQTRYDATIAGNVTLTGLGYLTVNSTAAYNGTMTVNSGRLNFRSTTSTSTDSNIVLSGGTLELSSQGSYSYGAWTVNQGSVSLGAINANHSVAATVTSLSGTGGAIQMQTNSAFTRVHQLTVDQDADTTYSGSISGISSPVSGNYNYLAFTKSGTGTLSLNGSLINLRGDVTTVSEGTLLINGAGSRSFESKIGGTAISVEDGGTFGGNSFIVLYGGDSVVVADGGVLAPGNAIGAVGQLTLAADIFGGSLDLSAVLLAENWLKFDLGSDAVAGGTYDQIRVASNNLNIGSGLLNFNDFSFNALSGFGEGTYTLFLVNAGGTLVGSLGTDLSGNIAGGYVGTISQSGNDILLNVVAVPEPSTVALALSALAILVWVRRRQVQAC